MPPKSNLNLKSNNKQTKAISNNKLQTQIHKIQNNTQSIQPNQNIKKPKILPPQPQPLTQEEIRQENLRKQALKRLSQLQQVSQQTQNKKSTHLLQQIIKNVQKDIVQSVVQIAEQPHEIGRFIQKKRDKLKNQQIKQLAQNQILDKEYRSLLQKKQLMLDQLRQMQYDESLKRKQLTDSFLGSPRQKVNKMPQFTQQNKQHWKKIRQMVKQYQQNSQRMKQLNQKKCQQELKLHIQLQQKRQKQKSQQKRKILEKKIKDIQIRHQQRTHHVKQSETIIQRLQKKTKLFQKMEDNWTRKQHQIKSHDQAAMFQSLHAKRLVNIRQLKRYELEHDIKFQEDEQKRKIKLTQSKISLSTQAFHRSRFSVDVIQEAKKTKQLEEQKLHEIKQLMTKKKEYAMNLKQKFRAKSRNQQKKQKSLQKNQGLKKQSRSISALDIRNKGNQYMRTMNSGVVSMKGRSKSRKQIPRIESDKKQYKNYLPQVLKNINKGNEDLSNKDIDMIQTIMRKQNASTEQKFFQAQMITKKMQSGGRQKDLLKSINAKIQILKRLSYNK